MNRESWLAIGLLIYLVLFLGAVGGLFIWKINRRGGRPPVAFKLLRGPGETLRRRLTKYDEDGVLRALFAAFLPPLVAGGVVAITAWSHPTSWGGLGAGVGAALVVFVVAGFFGGRLIFRDFKRYRDDRLGYLGEREVAEHLMPLLARGCRVFHDVPATGTKTDFNLDHVVIGPSGVAVVETKTFRKGTALAGRPDHVVVYDGAKLAWPWGSENRYGIDQAINNADWLAKFIRQRTGLEVEVRPIVALPGWWVESSRSPRAVPVINSKNVASAVESGPHVLSDEQIDLIARQVDVLCRDVED